MKINPFYWLISIFITKCSGDNCEKRDDGSIIRLEPTDADIGEMRTFTFNDSSNTLNLICVNYNYGSGGNKVKLTLKDKENRQKYMIVEKQCIFQHYRLNKNDDGAKITCSAIKIDINFNRQDFKDVILNLKYEVNSNSNAANGKTLLTATTDCIGRTRPISPNVASVLISVKLHARRARPMEIYNFYKNTTSLHIQCEAEKNVQNLELTYENITNHFKHLNESEHTSCVSYEMSLNSSCDGRQIMCSINKHGTATSYLTSDTTILLKYKDLDIIRTEEPIKNSDMRHPGGRKYDIWIGVAFALLVVGILGAGILGRFRRNHHRHQSGISVLHIVEHENSVYEEAQDAQSLTSNTNLEYSEPFDKEYYYSYAYSPIGNLVNKKIHIYAVPTFKQNIDNESSFGDIKYTEAYNYNDANRVTIEASNKEHAKCKNSEGICLRIQEKGVSVEIGKSDYKNVSKTNNLQRKGENHKIQINKELSEEI